MASFNSMGTDKKGKGHLNQASQTTPNGLYEPSPFIKAASQEYPWAAKMKSVCNLNRVTVPEYLEDGTPKVTVPSHVILQGIQNQREYVVGQFCHCFAPAGGESTYLFHIPDDATRKFVIQRGIWHVDDCLMFVSAWSPTETITLQEIKTIPVWLSLKNIPNQLYSFEGIKWIASGIGESMLTYKPWLDTTLMGEAKILVEVKLHRPFAQRVAIEDESGSVSMVDVVYSWLPSKCARCGQMGHKASGCLGQPLDPTSSTKTSSPVSRDVESSVTLANEANNMVRDKEDRDATVTVSHPPTPSVEATSDPILALVATINKPIDKIKDESRMEAKQDTTFSLKGKVEQSSPNTNSEHLSTHSITCNTTSNSHTPLVSSKETPYSSNHVSTNSAPADCSIRMSLSSSNLLTNRFSSLEFSDDEDETLISSDELDPKEYLSPQGKVFLQERPVKPSTKAKEMQLHSVARGRGNRNRGNRGRNRGGRG
ncbi:uncharacterized protein LOC106447869 [Brassica napus]|nr:uncharacterized protein LOC106447869 [Brassica napus]